MRRSGCGGRWWNGTLGGNRARAARARAPGVAKPGTSTTSPSTAISPSPPRHSHHQQKTISLSLFLSNIVPECTLQGVARKERLVSELQQRQQAKLSSFMCQILPHVLELQIRKATYTVSYLQSHASSWLACTHPHAYAPFSCPLTHATVCGIARKSGALHSHVTGIWCKV